MAPLGAGADAMTPYYLLRIFAILVDLGSVETLCLNRYTLSIVPKVATYASIVKDFNRA